MKVLSYNIMSGGFNDYGDVSNVPERLDLFKEIIDQEKADFVSLIDTYKWTEVYTPDNLKNIFGYKNVFLVKLDDKRLIKKGHDNGITVLTSLEVKSFKKIRLFNRNAIKTEVVFKGKEIDIFSVYLDDLSEDTRLEQIKSLFKLINKNKATVFMGDLNSLDKSDETIIPSINLGLDKVLKDMGRGEVISFIKEKDFNDSNIDKLKTVPTKLFPIKIDKPILRLDYIFYNQYLKSKNFEVLTGEIFDKTSDHFPIRVEF